MLRDRDECGLDQFHEFRNGHWASTQTHSQVSSQQAPCHEMHLKRWHDCPQWVCFLQGCSTGEWAYSLHLWCAEKEWLVCVNTPTKDFAEVIPRVQRHVHVRQRRNFGQRYFAFLDIWARNIAGFRMNENQKVMSNWMVWHCSKIGNEQPEGIDCCARAQTWLTGEALNSIVNHKSTFNNSKIPITVHCHSSRTNTESWWMHSPPCKLRRRNCKQQRWRSSCQRKQLCVQTHKLKFSSSNPMQLDHEKLNARFPHFGPKYPCLDRGTTSDSNFTEQATTKNSVPRIK